MPRSAPDGAEVRVFSRSPAPEAAEAAIEPARQSKDRAPQNRGRRAGSACQTTLADRLRGPADPMLVDTHHGPAPSTRARSRISITRARTAGSVPHDLPVTSGRVARRPPRASTGAVPSRIAVTSAIRPSTGTSLHPREISRPPHRCLPRRFPLASGSSVSFSSSTTIYPACIPRDVAGSFRRYPAIPAKARTQSPALAGNPRFSPPRPELPRPACHAGGRGFESRRSRKRPASSGIRRARPPDASLEAGQELLGAIM